MSDKKDEIREINKIFAKLDKGPHLEHVFVLSRHVSYEGDNVIDIYSDHMEANRARDRLTMANDQSDISYNVFEMELKQFADE